MKRYLHIFSMFSKNNLVREMEFRGNFLASVLISSTWVFFHIFVVNIYFQFTDNLLGWTKTEIFVFVGVFRIIKAFIDMFIRTNFKYFPDDVNSGQLDYSLTRPINTLFLSSFRFHKYNEIASLAAGFFIVVYAFKLGGFVFGPMVFLGLTLSIVVGLFVYYCLLLFFTTLSIFMTKLTAISEINNVLANALRYPTSTYTRGSVFLELAILPLTIVSTYPLQILFGKSPIWFIIIEIFLACLLFFLVYRFWLFALRHYSSASS